VALAIRKGTITSPGATGNQTTNLTTGGSWPVGTTPKAILLFGSLFTADGTSVIDTTFGVGVGTFRGGVVQQGYCATWDDDANTTIATSVSSGVDALLKGMISDAVIDFAASLVSLGSDQFVLNWTDLPTTASIVLQYVVLGGSDISDAYVHAFNLSTAAATQDVTVVGGFGQPDLNMFMHVGPDRTAAGTASGDGGLMLAWAKSDTERLASQFIMDDANGNTKIGAWQKARAILSLTGANPPLADAEADLAAKASWPTDGFRLSYADQAAIGVYTISLALKGTFQAAVGEDVTLTAGTTDDIATSFAPKGAILWGGTGGQTTAITTNGESEGQWMGASDLTNEGSAGHLDNDEATSAQAGQWHNTTKALEMRTASGTTGGAPVADAAADASASGNNLRLTYTTLSVTTARAFGYVILGDAAAGLTAVGRDLDLPWTIRTAVGRDLQTPWTVRTPIGRDSALLWTIRQAIGRDLVLPATIRAVVGRDLQAPWTIRVAVGRDVALPWTLRALAGRDILIPWTVRGRAGADLDLPWTIGAALVAVGRDLELGWTIRAAAGRDLVLPWTLRSSAGAELVLPWTVRALAGAELVVLWTIGDKAIAYPLKLTGRLGFGRAGGLGRSRAGGLSRSRAGGASRP
jgi:hypothetical protein